MRDYGFLAIALLLACLSACAGTRPKVSLTSVPNTFYVAPDGNDANPGTLDAPWATLNHAAATLRAGQTVYVREGVYAIAAQIRPKESGAPDAWITYAAYPGETPVIDADGVPVGPPGSDSPWPHDQGAFNIQGVHYICVHGLTLRNSHAAGFMVRDSTHVVLTNNTVDTTFSPGIAAWDTDHNGAGCEHIAFLGNTVIHANTWDMAPSWSDRQGEPPHEAISVAGAQHFEVAYNHVYACDKEGIDVKETSAHGRVHHNYVHDVARQGLYADSWFGVLEDVEVDHNVVYGCRGAGMAISVEEGSNAAAVLAEKRIVIDHNLVYDINDVFYPIHAGWTDNFADIYAFDGENAILTEPAFVAPLAGDFTLAEGADVDVGAFPAGTTADLWWQREFPPEIPLAEIPLAKTLLDDSLGGR